MRIDIAPGLSLDATEIAISFITASGPGGQNVNKVATAAQLRFDARNSLSLSNAVKVRLQALAGSKLTNGGVIVITARRHRTQEANRQDALDRLSALIQEAAIPPVKRRPTRPSYAARQKRVDAKTHRGAIKKGRALRPDD
jgi:ribosome-associated protein